MFLLLSHLSPLSQIEIQNGTLGTLETVGKKLFLHQFNEVPAEKPSNSSKSLGS